MKLVKDLGLRKCGSRNRRFVEVQCPLCGKTEEARVDSKTIDNDCCRTCKGFSPNVAGKTHTTSDFVAKASAAHKGFYTYDSTSFIKSAEKVTVTCPFHADFLVSPNNHLKGKGCPKCAVNKRGWNRSLYSDTPTSIYYAIVNDKYFKVGISKQGERHRYYKDHRYGNKIDIIVESWFFDGAVAYDLEKEMLLEIRDIKASENVLQHGGNTELHTEDMSELLITKIKERNEIN